MRCVIVKLAVWQFNYDPTMTTYLPILLLWCNTAIAPNLSIYGHSESLRNDMMRRINEIRARGCQCGDDYYAPAPPLSWDDRLAAAALRHAGDMARNGHFAHTGTDGSTTAQRVTEAGFNWQKIAENIAFGHRDLKSAIDDWLKSPGHCRNIMNPSYRQIGAAAEGVYWVQTLAKNR